VRDAGDVARGEEGAEAGGGVLHGGAVGRVDDASGIVDGVFIRQDVLIVGDKGAEEEPAGDVREMKSCKERENREGEMHFDRMQNLSSSIVHIFCERK
jgi:hypothetical protein